LGPIFHKGLRMWKILKLLENVDSVRLSEGDF